MFAEYLIAQILDIIWPPIGIIYFEEQIIQAIVAYAHAWVLQVGGPIILMGLAMYFIVVWVMLGRIPHFHAGRGLRRVIHTLYHMLINLVLAWAMLVYGAVRGERRAQPDEGENAGRRGENNATFRRRITPFYTLRHVSLHFRLGRAIYRGFYWLLNWLPILHRNERSERAHEIIARALTLIVIFWGVWRIPFDLGLV